MPHRLKEGAIFIADAHYPRNKKELLALFDHLNSYPPSQCFILGDMFEFLSAATPYSVVFNKELIDLIDALSQKTELFYLEGNHDYLLSSIFKNANVYKIEAQPLILEFEGAKIALLHGDKHSGATYKIYSKLIRSPFVIAFLRVATFDFGGRFIKTLYPKLLAKDICKNFDGIESLKGDGLANYERYGVSLVVEGHYHERGSFWLNNIRFEALEAFACNKSFFKVEFADKDIRFVKTSLGALKDGQAG